MSDVPKHLCTVSRDITRVGEGGLEPPHPFGHRNLNPARLPIPPLARVARGDASLSRVADPGPHPRLVPAVDFGVLAPQFTARMVGRSARSGRTDRGLLPAGGSSPETL